tara:strand:- start:1318 stop:2247 length:930 start_codon:yes stop_codon:yes gene_type:complete
MKTIPTEFYGDNVRWFMGRCIDASPPPGLEGRIKVRVFGVHSPNTDDIPQKDLPWAQVMNPSSSYGVSGLGVNTQILPGAMIFGIFLDGTSSQLPMVLGSLPSIEYPTSVQAASREDISTNPFAFIFDQTNAAVQDPVYYGTQSDDGLSEIEVKAQPRVDKNDVARFFIDNGLNAKQASSMTGVLMAISGLKSTNPGGIAGYPIDSPRYKRFIAYAKRLSPSKNFYELDVQLMFIMTELQTSQKTAYSKLLMSGQIEGNLYGENIDGIDKKGNGMVAALKKYFVHPDTLCDKEQAVSFANSVYSGLGAI